MLPHNLYVHPPCVCVCVSVGVCVLLCVGLRQLQPPLRVTSLIFPKSLIEPLHSGWGNQFPNCSRRCCPLLSAWGRTTTQLVWIMDKCCVIDESVNAGYGLFCLSIKNNGRTCHQDWLALSGKVIVKFWNDWTDWLLHQMWSKVNSKIIMCVWVLVFTCIYVRYTK